jgi:tol-pal system protein YbgF
LFEDDDARKAILDLRQRLDEVRLDVDRGRKASADESAALGKSLLDLQRQIELSRSEMSALRGENERLVRELTDVQRKLKDHVQTVNDRLVKLEPVKAKIDGVEFSADPRESRDFDAALGVFRKGDFSSAQSNFVAFIDRYPSSGYAPTALFWLANAQYATRDYKEAIVNFRALVAKNPGHVRAPEAVLSVANCQMELKDPKGAKKTLNELIKAYPESEAAVAAQERLSVLK